jgi:hypothetical protein
MFESKGIGKKVFLLKKFDSAHRKMPERVGASGD